jgi:hypothetical protein
VVCPFQLVLNKDPVAALDALAENVGSKGADIAFLRFEFKLDADCAAEDFKIFRACEPRGKIARFTQPCGPKINAF